MPKVLSASVLSITAAARSRKSLPASVSVARYCERSKSATPSSSSRLRTSLLTAGCDLWSVFDAAVNAPSLATARNAMS
jgi:hypothetical protein